MGTRITVNFARWPALILLVSLALTGCFRSAGKDLPPTQPGDTVLVGQNPTVTTPEVPLPTADTTGGPTAEVATGFPTPIATLSPFPTLARTTPTARVTQDGQGGPIVQQPPTRITIQPTFTQATRVAIQPTFTSPATQAVQATYTPLPTYTSQPTFTPLATQVVAQGPSQVTVPPTFTRAAPAAAGQPTITFTPVPYNPFSATPTYTPYPPAAAQVQPVQPQVVVVTQAPVEAVPLGEQPTLTLAPGGQGGPVVVETPAAVAQVASLTPDPFVQATPLPPQGPTLTGGQMTATQIVYGATATMAYLLGTPMFGTPPGGQVPGQTPIVVPPGQLPPNVTLVTATPLGQPGMCGEHRIAIGDTLSRIALQYGLTTQQVATANNITNPDLIEAGDTLQIPCATPTTGATPIPGQPTTAPTTGGQQVYTVQAGDNIYRISLRFGVDMGELVRINGLNEVTMNSIYVGQTLIIPASAVIVATPVPGTPIVGPTLTPYIIIVTPSTIG